MVLLRLCRQARVYEDIQQKSAEQRASKECDMVRRRMTLRCHDRPAAAVNGKLQEKDSPERAQESQH